MLFFPFVGAQFISNGFMLCMISSAYAVGIARLHVYSLYFSRFKNRSYT